MAGVRDGNSQYFLNFSGSPEFFRFFCKSEIYVFPMWNTEILPQEVPGQYNDDIASVDDREWHESFSCHAMSLFEKVVS